MLLSSKFSNHLLLLAHIYALRAGDAAYCYYTSYVAWSMSVCIVMYAASAWRGLASTSDRQRIDRARRNGYCASDLPSFDELCDDADDELFNKAVHLSNHVLHSLLLHHLAHHKDTICETERIYCSYLIIPHTCQTKTSSLTCCIKTHTDTALCSYTVICNLLANLLMKQFRRLSMTFFSVTCTFSFTFLLLWHAFCHVTNKRI